MKRKEILINARALIANPKHWVCGAFHKGKNAHCADGALMVAAGCELSALSKPYWRAYELLRSEMYGSVWDFNDGRSHDDVMGAFDRAIARA